MQYLSHSNSLRYANGIAYMHVKSCVYMGVRSFGSCNINLYVCRGDYRLLLIVNVCIMFGFLCGVIRAIRPLKLFDVCVSLIHWMFEVRFYLIQI